MNKKVVIIVVAALFLLGFFLVNKNKSTKMMGSDNKNTQVSDSKSGQKTLKDLLTAGVAQKCTFKDTSDATSIEGTSYVSGGMVRGDFSSTIDGETTSGHTIFKDDTSYVWMDDSSTGIKMSLDLADEEDANDADKQTQGLDLDKSMDYNCGAWVVDQSMFTPPTDVTFTSFTAPEMGDDAETETDNQSLCSACNSLSGDQKTQCLTSLKCE